MLRAVTMYILGAGKKLSFGNWFMRDRRELYYMKEQAGSFYNE